MKLAKYNSNNIDEIKKLFTQTFSDSEGKSEGLILGVLVNDLMMTTQDEDMYGFVAIENENIVGSIFFTRLTFKSKISAFMLSPVATHTSHQAKGTGQKLIAFGLNSLKQAGVELVVTYGDPNYYSKVGFKQITEKTIKSPFPLSQPEGWLGQSLVSDEIQPITEKPICVEAFNNPDLW